MQEKPNKQHNQKKKRRRKPVHPILLIFMDIILIGAALCVFAYYHHVKPVVYESTVIAETGDSSDVTLNATKQNTTNWSDKFPGKFTNGEVLSGESMYISDKVNVSLYQVQKNGVTYYVQDIYIADIECFKSALAKDSYGRNITEWVIDMAIDHNAVGAINGDFYGIDADGVVIRNGILYNDLADDDDDILVLYYDGTMKTFTVDAFDEQVEMQNGAYQAWCFGPALIDENGEAITSYYRSVGSIAGLNPRTAVGYYEPGHYCFVTVDGRKEGYSIGLTMPQLAQLFVDMGCKVAYNMDGGGTAVMTFGDEVVNQPYQGGRKTSDMIYITDIE